MSEKKQIALLEARVKSLEQAFDEVVRMQKNLVQSEFELIAMLAKKFGTDDWPVRLRKFHDHAKAMAEASGVNLWADE